MYVAHLDSKRRKWVFKIPYGKEQAGILARFLWDLAKLGKLESLTNPAAMFTNAALRDTTEQTVLTALSKQFPATVDDYNNAKPNERYIL